MDVVADACVFDITFVGCRAAIEEIEFAFAIAGVLTGDGHSALADATGDAFRQKVKKLLVAQGIFLDLFSARYGGIPKVTLDNGRDFDSDPVRARRQEALAVPPTVLAVVPNTSISLCREDAVDCGARSAAVRIRRLPP